MPMIYRLWTKIHKSEVDRWASTHEGPWGAAIKGSSALRAAIRSMFRDELESLSEEEIAGIFWGMENYNMTAAGAVDREFFYI